MIAIPAIDLINQQVVRLFQGDYNQQTDYAVSPFEYAKEIAASGNEFLHLVDLSGAKIGQLVHVGLLQEMTEKTNLKIDFGGGVKTKEDVETILRAGANQVVIGSLCVKETPTVLNWLKEFGSERFVLALDTDGEFLKIKGWQESSGVQLEELMRHFEPFHNLTILTTDIRRDGTGAGPSLALYEQLTKQFPNQRWIASGGVEQLSDLHALRAVGCYACVVGKALLEGKITLSELKEFNDERL